MQNAGRRDLTITKLTLQPEGYYTARVSSNGQTFNVDNKFGSWQAEVRNGPRQRSFCRRDVLPRVAAALQDKLPATERKPGRKAVTA